jgi:protease I
VNHHEHRLDAKRIAGLATDGVEQVELAESVRAIHEAGGATALVSLESGTIQAFDRIEKGNVLPVDRTIGEVGAEELGGLVLPGGVANPDRLRMDERAVGFGRAFFEQGKPAGAICHGPWTLVEELAEGAHEGQAHLAAGAGRRAG